MKIYIFILYFLVFMQLSFAQSGDDPAKKYTSKNDYLSALNIYNKLMEDDDNNADLYFKRAYAYRYLHENIKALNDYTKSLEINPSCIECMIAIAEINIDIENIPEAEKYLEQLEKKTGTTTDVLLIKAKIAENSGDIQKAIDYYETALIEDVSNKKIYAYRAITYLKIENYQEAHNDLSRAIEIDPSNDLYRYYRAYIYMLHDMKDDAIEDLKKCILLNNYEKEYYLRLAQLYYDKEQLNNAEEVYLNYLERHPDDAEILQKLGEVYFFMDNYDYFCECFNNVIVLLENNSNQKLPIENLYDKYCNENKMSYWFIRSLNSFNLNNFLEASNIAEKGINVAPESPVLNNLLGEIMLSRGEYTLADNYFNKAIENASQLEVDIRDYMSTTINQQDMKILVNSYHVKNDFGVSKAMLLTNDIKAAEESIEKAISLAETIEHFDGKELLYNLRAYILLSKNQVEEASNNLDKALEVNSGNFYTYNNIALLNLLMAGKTKPKSYRYTYIPEQKLCRMIIPKIKENSNNRDFIEKALEYCEIVIEYDRTNAYAYLIKSKVLHLDKREEFKDYAIKAREYGIFNSFSELGIK